MLSGIPFVVILNIPNLVNTRVVATKTSDDLKKCLYHSAQAIVICLMIMSIVGMDYYLAMRKKISFVKTK